MKNIVVLGAGTAGTMAANMLTKEKVLENWTITVVDKNNDHEYQPGFLFVPFGMMPAKRITKSRRKFLPKRAAFVQEDVVAIDRDAQVVVLDSGERLPYDQLIIATGTVPRPDLVPGMEDGSLWYDKVFDFYTLKGAEGLKAKLKQLKRGRLVVNVCEMPIKCPVAPLEFALLAQDYLRKRGRGFDVDVVFVTPLDGAFTKPVASEALGHLLAERGIEVVTDFQIESIDNERAELVSYDGRRVPLGLLRFWLSPGFMPPEQRHPSLWSRTRPVSASRADAASVSGDTSPRSTTQSRGAAPAGSATNTDRARSSGAARRNSPWPRCRHINRLIWADFWLLSCLVLFGVRACRGVVDEVV